MSRTKVEISITKKKNLGNYENLDTSISVTIEDDTSNANIHKEFECLRDLVAAEEAKSVSAFGKKQSKPSVMDSVEDDDFLS